MTKFRITAQRKDLYAGKNRRTIEADGKLKCSEMKLEMLMNLFLEMLDDMK